MLEDFGKDPLWIYTPIHRQHEPIYAIPNWMLTKHELRFGVSQRR